VLPSRRRISDVRWTEFSNSAIDKTPTPSGRFAET
jgi:hypothetical protein